MAKAYPKGSTPAMGNPLLISPLSRFRGVGAAPLSPSAGIREAVGVGERDLTPPTPRKGVQRAPTSQYEGSEVISAATDPRLQVKRNMRLVLAHAARQGMSREAVAERMSEVLDRPYSAKRLEKQAADSNLDSQLTLAEAAALCKAVGSDLVLQPTLDELGLVAVEPEVARLGRLALDTWKLLREFGEVA